MIVDVRAARFDDLDAIVKLHLCAFAGFFLSILGPRFLFELYRGFLTTPGGRLLIAHVDGSIRGCVGGTLEPEGFFRKLLLTRGLAFAWSAFGAAVQRPRLVVPRLLAAVRYRGERPPRLDGAALLSSLAVDPDVSGAGIGATLLNAYCEEARKNGLRYVYLVTDRDGNERVKRFYERHGFRVEAVIDRRDGRTMVRYVRSLAD